jgi:hypothetical protein
MQTTDDMKPCSRCGQRRSYQFTSLKNRAYVCCSKCGNGVRGNDIDDAKKERNNLAEPSAPQWTTETPDEEGVYWIAFTQHSGLDCVRVFERDGIYFVARHFVVTVTEISEFARNCHVSHWLKIDVPPIPGVPAK